MAAKDKKVVEPYALSCALKEGLANYKFLYVTAQTGWGKTTAVRRHFRGRRHTYASLWDDDALDKAERDATGLVILDDCHVLADQPERRERLTALLRGTAEGGHVVLLSRAPLPDWLFPFQLAGLLTVIHDTAFRLGTEDVASLAADMGLDLSQEDVLRLHRESRGFPVAVKIICLRLAEGKPLTTETVNSGYSQMFAYFDQQLFSYWDSKIRRLLLSVSFFDSFTVELARVLTGDSQTEQTLNHLLQISSFLDRDGEAYTIRYAPFRAYLRHKAETTWSRQERSALRSNAGMYYQLTGNLPAALECYAEDENHAKVSELLTEHARFHPGHGVYYQLRKYYRSLPEQEILSSPELMSGMSILCSLTFDVDESEKWYNALKACADSLNRRSPNYREVRGLGHYLDIALPHRGSVNLKDILLLAAGQLGAGNIRLPEFSVTSNLPSVLRGGKDFSAWVPKDKLLYNTIRTPVEAVLGRLGVGLADVALAESRYEKGEDISDAFLTLASRRMDVQRRGAPELEFVLAALTAKCQCDKGEREQAVSDISAFRGRMAELGQKQLLPNIDALLCRFDLLGNGEYAHKWLVEQAPDENDFFIMERYRYLTKARCYLQRRDYLTALALLGRLLDYFTRYDRTLDQIETLLLLAVCRYRMEEADWREQLAAALELAEPYGYVTVLAHEGAALLPLLRDWPEPENRERRQYLDRIQKAVQSYAARYPDYLVPGGSAAVQTLTKKELEVLRLICRNKTNEEIREILNISENTLKTHIRRLFGKLNVSSRTEAKAAAERLHLI